MHLRYIYPVGFPVDPKLNTVSTVLSLLATQQTLNFKNQLLAIKGTLASLHCCCPSFVATDIAHTVQGLEANRTLKSNQWVVKKVSASPDLEVLP